MRTSLRAAVFCGLLASVVHGQAQSVYTPYAFTNFAGQPGGPGSSDGTGSGARFFVPQGMAVDNGGNPYVADTQNYLMLSIPFIGDATRFFRAYLTP